MNQNDTAYRRLILQISGELTSSDYGSLAFYLYKTIPGGKLEALNNRPLDLFVELERNGYIGPEKLEFLQTTLEAINRQDLVCEVEKFDCSRWPRLIPKSANCVENSGYRLGINGGNHLVNDNGDEYVHLQSGQSYELVINNTNTHRCRCEVKIDGHVIFPRLIIEAGGEVTLDRPCHTAGQFKFFAVKDAPLDSGIVERNTEENGCIQVTFTPEVTKMKITCFFGEGRNSVTCSLNTTDIELHRWISSMYNIDAATVLINGWKPLRKENMKLVDYDVHDGSYVFINFGLVGGVNAPTCPTAERYENEAPESIQWIPGATTMQGRSEQTFENIFDFVPDNEKGKVALHLRLVARADGLSLPSNGECIPFILGNRRPPPV